MSPHRAVVAMVVGLGVVYANSIVEAQARMDPPNNPPVLVGPLTLAPSVDTTAGHDNNLFNEADTANPRSDFKATFSPVVDGWLRLPRARAGGHGRADFFYYKDFVDLRSIDWSTNGRLDVPLNRVTPFVYGSFIRTTNSQNVEIDAIAGLSTSNFESGASVRLTERTSLELAFARQKLNYDETARYGSENLGEELDYVSKGGRLVFRYDLTPLTTLGVRGAMSRDRFEVSSDRDSDNSLIAPFIELKPLALISGTASIGVQHRTSLAGTAPDFTGTVVNADLTYVLLDRTRFTVSATRQLQYSYIGGRTDYLQTGLSLTVTQQLGDSWDVAGNFGRSHLSYRESTVPGSDVVVTYPDELYFGSGIGVGYRLSRTRIGFRVDYSTRDGNADLAGYGRTRAFSTVTYTY